ncbi:MAG: queuosine precursor transporter [Bdellovibrionales bacterium]
MAHQGLRVTAHDYEWHPKYFHIIVGLFCALYMITLALCSKLIEIQGFTLVAGVLVFPLCCIITDLLTEVYGFNRTRQAVWTTMFCAALYAAFTQMSIGLPPAPDWPNQEAYATVHGTSFRVAVAGMAAWVVGELINSLVMSRMKILQHAKAMPLRFIGSTVIGQLADNVVFVGLAFAGTVPNDVLLQMILVGWLIKIIYEVIALPLSVPIAKWVKRLEGVEHYDKQKLSVV